MPKTLVIEMVSMMFGVQDIENEFLLIIEISIAISLYKTEPVYDQFKSSNTPFHISPPPLFAPI